MGVHFPFFIFHLEWKIKMTVCTRTLFHTADTDKTRLPLAVSANCDVIFRNWVRLVYNAFTPQTRLDKTVQSPIYSGPLKTVGDCRELISHRTPGQDKTVLSYPRLRCELGIYVQKFLPRCMQCRRGLAIRILSVCLSVCLSVRLSNACFVTKR